MGKPLLSHRSTLYPCYVPVLGGSRGAGRKRLTRRKSRKKSQTEEINMRLQFIGLILSWKKLN